MTHNSMRMHALVLQENGEVSLMRDYPRPVAGPGEALVRVIRVGLCNTDLEVIKGYSGFVGVLGHEFLGVVEYAEENEKIKSGQRVVGEINVQCNDCENCDKGGIVRRNHCERHTVMGIKGKDGTFAEYLTLPIHNLLVVPSGVSDAAATFVEPLAAAFRIVEQGLVSGSDSVAVIGDGKLGLLITEVLKLQNLKRLCLFGRHAQKMALVGSDVEKIISEEGTGENYQDAFDVTVEASGSPSGLMMAAQITRPLGCVVLKTTCSDDKSSSFNAAPFVVKELRIVGSRCGNFTMALDALESGQIEPEKYIDTVYPFTEALEALKHASRKGVMKIQLKFE